MSTIFWIFVVIDVLLLAGFITAFVLGSRKPKVNAEYLEKHARKEPW